MFVSSAPNSLVLSIEKVFMFLVQILSFSSFFIPASGKAQEIQEDSCMLFRKWYMLSWEIHGSPETLAVIAVEINYSLPKTKESRNVKIQNQENFYSFL
jgi:hypothetical protein